MVAVAPKQLRMTAAACQRGSGIHVLAPSVWRCVPCTLHALRAHPKLGVPTSWTSTAATHGQSRVHWLPFPGRPQNVEPCCVPDGSQGQRPRG